MPTVKGGRSEPEEGERAGHTERSAQPIPGGRRGRFEMTQGTRPHTFAEASGPAAADFLASALFAAGAAPVNLLGGLVCFIALAHIGARRKVRPGLAETGVLAQRMSL